MGAIRNIIYLFLVFCVSSCSLIGIDVLFERGYVNENGQYVPKKDNFKLKDKQNNIILDNLDTINIYQLDKRYYNGIIHPDANDIYSESNKVKEYLIFFSNGRCLGVSIPLKDEFGFENNLKEKDLNPNNSYCDKKYYYSNDGKIIKIESFVYGEGYGRYLIFDYYLNKDGDTLTMNYKSTKEVYVKKNINKNWSRYKVDW